MHAAGEHSSNQDPKKAGSEHKRSGKRGTDKGAGSGDGREVMAEKNPLRRGHVVMPVFVNVSGSGATIIQGEGLGSDEGAVVAIANRVNAESGKENRKSVHRYCLVMPFRPPVCYGVSPPGAKTTNVLSQVAEAGVKILLLLE